jgi:tRNA dimethylallyltransferase
MKTLTNTSQIPVLVGPTGVGKSEVAYHLALQAGYEIISADAFQVYKGMEIGTAQPSPALQVKVKHHLVGVRKPKEAWNAVRFAESAKKILDEGQKAGHKFLIVGGAGFYIRALVEGPPQGGAPSPETRTMVMEKVGELGPEKAHEWLASRDAEAAQRLNPQDLRRVCRALEKTFETITVEVNYEPLGVDHVKFFGLERSRENLDKLLRHRTEAMWREGLLTETENLMKLSLPIDHPALAAIGYAEASSYLRENMTQEEALERIFRRTRQYAKRQWTWFKHQHEVEWFNLDEYASLESLVQTLKEKLGE